MYDKLNATPIEVPAPLTYTDPRLAGQRDRIGRLIAHYTTPALAQHLVSVEVAMYGLAAEYGEEKERERWALAGLLHDLDWDACRKDASFHCKQGTREWLEKEGIDRSIVEDACSHFGWVAGPGGEKIGFADGSGLPVDTRLRQALFAVDELCGFIIACALVRPSRSVSDMEPSSVMKKLKDKRFAALVDRALIRSCEATLGTPLAELVAKTLALLQKHASAFEGMK